MAATGLGKRVGRWAIGGLAGVWAAALGAPALAQGVGNLVPQGSPIPQALPPPLPAAPGGITVPGLATPTQGLTGTAPVRSVAIAGATAYSRLQMEAITAGLVGPATPVAKIEAVRVALLNQYRRDGYALTSVTADLAANGTLRFTVIEGSIVEVKLDGDVGPAGVQVLRFLNHLTQVRPLDNATLERWVLLAQDVPGISLRAVLQPSATDPGALTLVAQVDHKPLAGLLSADNRAFRLTGPEQMVALVEADSLTQLGERTSATLYHTFNNTQTFGQGSVEVFVGGSGLRFRAYGGYGEANPSDFLRAVGYHGTTTTFGGAFTYPVIRGRQHTLNVSLGLDAIETTINLDAGPAGSSIQTGRDALRVLRFGADDAVQDGLLGDSRPGLNGLSIRVSKGLTGLGASSNGEATLSRKNAKIDFTKAVIDASRVQTLFRPWTDATVALKGRVIGQVTGDVLPPAEKFFLGGSEFNRGYYSGEVTGDNALVLSAELQLNDAYTLNAFGRALPIAAQYYAFYDYGQTWENQSLDSNAHLSSMGIGGRFLVTRFTEFGLEGVHQITRRVGGSTPSVSPLKADAIYWRVVTRF